MPFKSDKQRRYLYAKHPAIAKRWAAHEKALDKKKKHASFDPTTLDPAVLTNAGLGVAEGLVGLQLHPLARAAVVGGAGAMSAQPGENAALHGIATGVGSGTGHALATALQEAAAHGSLGSTARGLSGKPLPRMALKALLGGGGTLAGRALAVRADRDAVRGHVDALTDYGVEKVAFNWGGAARGAATWGGKALGLGAKVLGVAPTGWGNLIAGGLGAVGGAMQAAGEGHGWAGMLAHAGAGAMAGLPGGLGMAASMFAPMAINKVMPPPPPKQPGMNIGG